MEKYSIETIKESIDLANKSEIAVVFPKLAPEVPDWGSFINLIETEAHGAPMGGMPQSPFEERWINGIIIRNLFYLTVRISKKESIKEIKSVEEIFKNIFNRELDPVAAFINIVGGEKAGQAHKDNRETIFWQCQGFSEWTIYEDLAEEDREHKDVSVKRYETSQPKILKIIDLRPGDVLYIRNGGIHSVRNQGPRASIAFMPREVR